MEQGVVSWARQISGTLEMSAEAIKRGTEILKRLFKTVGKIVPWVRNRSSISLVPHE